MKKNYTSKFVFSPELKELLEQRKENLSRLIQQLECQGEDMPKGFLRVVDKRKYIQYYWRQESADLNGVFITRENIALAKSLAKKAYNQKLLAKASEEYKLLSRYLEYLANNSLEDVFSNLHRGKRMLVDPLVPDQTTIVSEWLDDEYEAMPFVDPTEFYTTKEIRVRSKSELVIANLLEQYEVPYKYEKPLYLRGLGQIRPDFTCLNTRTRKEYVWEHFGMMDNAIYANKNVEKIAVYQQNGFFAGKNMIATFESTLQPLSTKNIKATIEEYLL